MKSQTYHKQIDGLRFVAVFLVVAEHIAWPVAKMFTAGAYGVNLFFVISGFLITTILLNSSEPFGAAYKKFIGRRCLRIFPLYYLTILFLFLLNCQPVHKQLGSLLSYTYNYAMVQHALPFSTITHFWTLCVEEQFYLFWPFIVLLTRKTSKFFYLVLFLLITFCYLQSMFFLVKQINPYNLTGLLPRGGTILLGAFGAVAYKKNRISLQFFRSKHLEIAILIVLLFSLVTSYTFKFLVLDFCSLFLVIKAVYGEFSVKFLNKVLSHEKVCYMGSISYGIYVFHLPLSYYLIDSFFVPAVFEKIPFKQLGAFSAIEWNGWILTFPLVFISTVCVAHLSYKYIEKPLLGLKDRFFRYSHDVEPQNNKRAVLTLVKMKEDVI